MASCVRNICAKNCQNLLTLLKVTIDNVGIPFLRHSVYIPSHFYNDIWTPHVDVLFASLFGEFCQQELDKLQFVNALK